MVALWNSKMMVVVGLLVLSLCAGKGYCRPNDAADESDYNNDDPVYDDEDDEDDDAYTGPPPYFKSQPTNLSAMVGESLVLDCSSLYADTFVQIWLNNSESLFVAGTKLTQDNRVSLLPNHSLELTNLRLEDSGPYTCQISSDPVLNLTHYVTVTSPAKIVKILPAGNDKTLREGDTLTLQCITSGFPEPFITWSREDKKHFPNGDKVAVGKTVTIENISSHYGGTYTCKADNNLSKPVMEVVKIHVNYRPTIQVETGLFITGEGEECDLSCTVHADPNAKVVWRKNGKPVEKSERIHISNKGSEHVLKINKLKREDFGKYYCIAKNSLGTVEKALEISGAPSKPNFSTVKSEGDSGVILEWSVTSYAPISAFLIHYKKKLAKSWDIAELRELNHDGPMYKVKHSLNHLSTGEYLVYLRATNEFGSTNSDHKEFHHDDNGAPAAETSVAGPSNGANIASLRPKTLALVTIIILSAYIL